MVYHTAIIETSTCVRGQQGFQWRVGSGTTAGGYIKI
jgi:hypothetical protein